VVRAEAQRDVSADVEEAVLRLLVDNPEEHVIPQIVSLLRMTGIDDATIKAAILRLTSEGRIELTPDWTVRRSACST
jgi:DNA-binding transcriptional regulator PaaX